MIIMKIWIDISNTPHVLFFRGFIKKIETDHKILITCREHAEIIPLLKKYNIKYRVVGKHEGRGKINKIFGLIKRNFKLIPIVSKFKPDISFSCGSPYAAQTSFLLRVPHIAIMDNETAKISNYLTIPFCKKVIIPKVIPKKLISRYIIKQKSIIQYNGFKEMAYLENFKPDKTVLKHLNLKKSDKIALIRSELLTALYYRDNKKTPLTYEIIKYLSENTNYKIVFLARTNKERKIFKNYKNVITPNSIDTPSLMHYSKFVISGGGTMNREACILGIPAITTYPLKTMLCVDRYFVKNGYMLHIKKLDDFKKILNKKTIKKINKNMLKNPLNSLYKIIQTYGS